MIEQGPFCLVDEVIRRRRVLPALLGARLHQHARASAKFVGAVAELSDATKVTIAKDGNEAAGGSILGLMMLGAAKGDSVEVIVSGDNSDAVLADLCGLIEDGFGEE